MAESLGTEGHRRYFTGKRESEATRNSAGTGLIDFGARWYDPEIGRFLGIDPIVQVPSNPASHNPYSYVWNDPVNLTDPTGAGIRDEIAEIVIGALGVFFGGPLGKVLGVVLILNGSAGLGLAAEYGEYDLAVGLSISAAVVSGGSEIAGVSSFSAAAATAGTGAALGEGASLTGALIMAAQAGENVDVALQQAKSSDEEYRDIVVDTQKRIALGAALNRVIQALTRHIDFIDGRMEEVSFYLWINRSGIASLITGAIILLGKSIRKLKDLPLGLGRYPEAAGTSVEITGRTLESTRNAEIARRSAELAELTTIRSRLMNSMETLQSLREQILSAEVPSKPDGPRGVSEP